jgi:hypothetical protein
MIQRRFWRQLEAAESWLLSEQEWDSILGTRERSELSESGALQALSSDERDGLSLRLDLGDGYRDFDLQRDGAGSFRALPENGSAFKLSNEQSRAHRLSRERFLKHLADRNEFKFQPNERTVPRIFPVGRTVIGSHSIPWFICCDQDAFKEHSTSLFMRELSKSHIAIVSMPDPSAPIPFGVPAPPNLIAAPLPSGETWVLDRQLFCKHDFFRARDVADQLYRFDKRVLFVDENEKLIFIHGRLITVRKDSNPYKLVRGLTRYTSPVELDYFGTKELGYQLRHGPADHVHNALKQVRTAIEKSITDEAVRAEARKLFESQLDNHLKLPLEPSQIQLWKASDES